MGRSELTAEIGHAEPHRSALPTPSVPARASAWQPRFEGPGTAVEPPATPWHPAMRRLLGGLPPLVRDTLTPTQLEALSNATEPQPAPHLISYRVSIPLPWRRYYLAIYFGREKRSQKRLSLEGQTGVRPVGIAIVALTSAVGGIAMFGLVLLLYFLKSALGIDLYDGPSILHDVLF